MSSSGTKRIRVLVVDDSAVMRKLVTNLLEKDPEIQVIATAIDGLFALSKIEQLKPDVVTLDVDMPRLDGLTALEQIVSRFAIPVVMLSALTMRGARLAMQAIEKGAMDFVAKPKVASQIGEVAEELIEKVKAAAHSRPLLMSGEPAAQRGPKTGTGALVLPPSLMAPSVAAPAKDQAPVKLVAIGASSGGPHALRYLLPKLPADFPAGIVVVQHLPESFTGMFAKWLDELCKIKVREARDGSMATRGCALIAPGDAHLKVKRRSNGAEAKLDRGIPVNGHKPSVDVLFHSVAEEYGDQVLAVIMTGMGGDGSDGIGQIQKAGGLTVAQDEKSCMIFGMPKVAIKKGFIDRVVALDEMASYLIATVGS